MNETCVCVSFLAGHYEEREKKTGVKACYAQAQ